MSSKNDKPTAKEVMAVFSIIAVFFLALALAISVLVELLGGGSSVLSRVLQAVALAIAIAIVAINSIDVAKRIKQKWLFWAWVVAIIIVVIFLVITFVNAF